MLGPRVTLAVHLLASIGGALSVVGGLVMPDARVVAAGGVLLIVGGAAAFTAGKTLTPTGWGRPAVLSAIRDPLDRAAAERALAWVVGSLLVVVGTLIVILSLARALG